MRDVIKPDLIYGIDGSPLTLDWPSDNYFWTVDVPERVQAAILSLFDSRGDASCQASRHADCGDGYSVGWNEEGSYTFTFFVDDGTQVHWICESCASAYMPTLVQSLLTPQLLTQ